MSLLVPSAIKPLPEYRLWLRYPDGTEGVADLSDLAGQGVFHRWREHPQTFHNVVIAEDGSLVWDGELDLCADALYLEISGKSVEEVFPNLKGELLHA